MHPQHEISKHDIEIAHSRIKNYIHRTPIMFSSEINKFLGCEVFFKCENLQKIGAFKARGAMNAVLSLDKIQLKDGVCTHSSGNHAQALARSASLLNVAAHIVMPNNSPKVKIDAVQGYGGIVYLCEPTLEARETTLAMVQKKTGAYFVHPYNNIQIIAGQATAAKEVFEQINDLEYIIAPVGGGGLLSGTALSTHYFSPNTKVIGAEPENANDAFLSLKTGVIHDAFKPNTIADGLLTSLGNITFPLIQKYVAEIKCCTENSIVLALQLIFERLKIVVEPSAATALAIILENKSYFANAKVGIILSGGNIDLSSFFFNLKNKNGK